MANQKAIVPVKKKDKLMNQIWNELNIKHECIIESTNTEWHGTIRSFSITVKKKNLEKKGFIQPLWINMDRQSNKVLARLIRLNPNTEIEKKPGNNQDFYHLKLKKRRKLI